MKADIVIAGAGIAGLCAAASCKDKNRSIVIVEKSHTIGGTARDCFHPFICGLFKNQSSGFEIANPGMASEIHDHLLKRSGDKCLVRMGKVELMAVDHKTLWGFFEKKLSADNITVMTGTTLLDVISKGRNVTALKVDGPDKNQVIETCALIDATGGAGLAAQAAKHLIRDNSTQMGGFCMLFSGTLSDNLSLQVPYHARLIVAEFKLSSWLKWVTISSNPVSGDHVLKFNVRSSDDIPDCRLIYEQLVQKIPALGALTLEKSSEQFHPRASADVYIKDPDSQDDQTLSGVASFWPEETWDAQKGSGYVYCPDDTPWQIPENAFADPLYDNVFGAGKSIRVSGQLHASSRVMGICMATGEKAMVRALDYLKGAAAGNNVR